MPGVMDFGAAVRPVEGDAALVLPDGAVFDWGRYVGNEDRFTLHLRVRLKPGAEPPGFAEHYLFSWMAGDRAARE